MFSEQCALQRVRDYHFRLVDVNCERSNVIALSRQNHNLVFRDLPIETVPTQVLSYALEHGRHLSAEDRGDVEAVATAGI